MEKNTDDSKEDIVNDVNKAFKKAKMQVEHLYPILDLDELYMFKVFHNGYLVDEKDDPDKERASSPKEEDTIMPKTILGNDEKDVCIQMKASPPIHHLDFSSIMFLF